MGKLLGKVYDSAYETGGLDAQKFLEIMTGMSKEKALAVDDNGENMLLFEEAFVALSYPSSALPLPQLKWPRGE